MIKVSTAVNEYDAIICNNDDDDDHMCVWEILIVDWKHYARVASVCGREQPIYCVM